MQGSRVSETVNMLTSLDLSIINGTLFSERRLSCVSRSRRFGKSMAAKMLCAYYDQSCDSCSLFADLVIAKDATFEKHLNKYPVIYLDITDFVSKYRTDDIVDKIDAALLADVSNAYPQVPIEENDGLMDYLLRVSEKTQEQFIFIIDEWDAICREFSPGTKAMDAYVSWLRGLFKSQQAMRVFACAYMTGILPIKKYKTQSALNNFIEYSMVEPRRMASYFGFTKDEVRTLAEKYHADFDELEKWYDGYQIGDELSIFNPDSIMRAIYGVHPTAYWWGTSSIHILEPYINENFDGLLDVAIKLIDGLRYEINIDNSDNLLFDIDSKDDVLTTLVHFGYLTYNHKSHECFIPNREVMSRFKMYADTTSCRYQLRS